MANDWAEAAWVVKTLQKKFKLNENARIYTETLEEIQNDINDIIRQKATFVDKESSSIDEEGNIHIFPSGDNEHSEDYFQDTLWFILED